MPEQHTVQPGECIDSMAFEAGMTPKKIWNAPENEELRRARDGPNVLAPGDVVTIPDKTPRLEPAETEKRHRYRSVCWRVKLRVRILDQGEPRAGEKYTLLVGEQKLTGTTDDDGVVEQMVPAWEKRAVLRLGEAEDYMLHIGELDPLAKATGVQARLNNLGYGPLEVTGQAGDRTRGALRQFQGAHGLPVTGEADQATIDELEKAHGS